MSVSNQPKKKPYPKRIQLGEEIYSIIREEIREQEIWAGVLPFIKDVSIPSMIAGNATALIVKLVQNNYRRRVR